MSKKIVYIGNMLSDNDRNITTIEYLSHKLKSIGYHVNCYSNQKNKAMRLLSMLYGIIKCRHYDYALIDTYSTSAFWFAWCSAKLCQLLKLKYIMILHGGNLPYRLDQNQKLCQSIFKKSYCNITPSSYLSDAFMQRGYTNIKIIHNSIELEHYTFKKRQNISPNLLWVRAFDEIYNPLLALKTLEHIKVNYPNATLSMIGPSKDKSIEVCQTYAKDKNLSVEFTGKMKKNEWLEYSKHFDIFINTTHVDNTPVSIIEALALGLPVVSTNVGGIPYLLNDGKNSLLVPPNDPEAMGLATQKLIQDAELCNKLIENGKKLVREYDWEYIKHKWNDILA